MWAPAALVQARSSGVTTPLGKVTFKEHGRDFETLLHRDAGSSEHRFRCVGICCGISGYLIFCTPKVGDNQDAC